jgi:uncharacterized repeat protein (TIGR02543 family)
VKNRDTLPGVIRRVGVVGLLALLGALALGGGASPARAAVTPPTLKIEVIGQGKVTGTGINCGLGKLACYATYSDATPIALTASPANAATGWHFDHWEDDAGATCAGTPGANPCSVAPSSAGATATAVFDPPSGVIQTATYGVAVASTSNGTVTNDSTGYPIDCGDTNTSCSLTTYSGSTITVVETPDPTYSFGGWGGACSGTAASCATYLAGNQTASATFISQSATNELQVGVTGNGTVTGGGIACGAGSTCYAQEPPNATVTLTARAASGYGFAGWGGVCSGTQSTCTVQMDQADRMVTADFEPLVPFSVTVSGNGTVSGGGVTCGPGPQSCAGTTDPDQTLTFTATPATGATVFWSGCSSSAGSICSVDVTTNAVSVTATFSGGTAPPVATYALSLSVLGDGYVTSALNSSVHCTAAGGTGCTVNLNQNTTITLTAVPASGASTDFSGWTGACQTFTTTTCTLTMTGPKTVGANFIGGNTTYVLTGQVSGLGTITGGGLNCTSSGGAGCTVPQAAGAGITLTATPSFGAAFSGWSGACSGTSPTCAVSMTNAKSVTAAFQTSGGGAVGETIALTVAGAGSVTGAGVACASTATKSKLCTVQATHGQAMTLTAKAAVGYVFAGWTGACSGKKATCEVTVNTPLTIGAAFERPALASTRAPKVVKDHVTFSYRSLYSGTMKLVATMSGKAVGSRSAKVKVGAHTIAMNLPGKGRYVVTLTVKSKAGSHSIRWRVTIK